MVSNSRPVSAASLGVVLVAGLLLAAGGCGKGQRPGTSKGGTIRVFVGAVLGPAVAQIADRFTQEAHVQVTRIEGPASGLAAQIDKGDSCDVFVPAGDKWMDWLEQHGKVEKGTRREIARGTLVLIAPKGKAFAFDPAGGVPLGKAFMGRLAILDPDHVPVGAVTKQALEKAGWWAELASRTDGTADPKSTVAIVGKAQCAAGIVCASDAMGSPLVEVVATIPEKFYDPMTYPAAIITGHATPAARRFVEFLGSAGARETFTRLGFQVQK